MVLLRVPLLRGSVPIRKDGRPEHIPTSFNKERVMNNNRPTVKIGPQTANTVEVYIGEVRILASETDIRIEAKGANVEVIS